MTRKEIENEKKEFIMFIIIGIIVHIAAISVVVVQLLPEITIVAIIKAIFFGISMIVTLVLYWINLIKYAKAIKNAEKKLEDK